MNDRNVSTIFGIVALMLWSVGSSMVLSLQRIPAAQLLFVSWLVCFAFYAIYLSRTKQWHIVKQPVLIWVVGTIGICGTHFVTVFALKIAPAADVHILSSLWPIFVVFLSTILPNERFMLRSAMGSLIGFLGVCLLIYQGQSFSTNPKYFIGYSLALTSSILWSLYILFSRRNKDIPLEMVGMYSGIGAIFALAWHLKYEQTVLPNLFEWFMLTLKGLSTSVIGYYCWEIGIKRGNIHLLSVLHYFNPLVAVSLLYGFGFDKPSLNTVLGAVIIVLAAFLTGLKSKSSKTTSSATKRISVNLSCYTKN